MDGNLETTECPIYDNYIAAYKYRKWIPFKHCSEMYSKSLVSFGTWQLDIFEHIVLN